MPMLFNHQDQLRFIDFMSDLDTNLLYPIELFLSELSKIGIEVSVDPNNKELLVGTHRIYLASAEWGEDGIFAPHVLEYILTDMGIEISSNQLTIADRYKDRISKLKLIWMLD
jgi:hypothetical protein